MLVMTNDLPQCDDFLNALWLSKLSVLLLQFGGFQSGAWAPHASAN